MAKTGAFDSQVDRYEGWFEKNSLAYESQVEAVRSVLPSGNGVEIGVGTGRFAVPLGIKLGVDPSEAMREVARKKADPDYALIPMTLEGCIVRMADTIAYIGRDLEDAIRLGYLRRKEIPADVVAVLGDSNGTIV